MTRPDDPHRPSPEQLRLELETAEPDTDPLQAFVDYRDSADPYDPRLARLPY